MKSETARLIAEGGVAKGDALAVARVAGIMAAKRVGDLIPLCHPISITSVELDLDVELSGTVEIRACVRTVGPTGVEMEALTSVSVAALALYDMCKAVDRDMTIGDIRLVEKSGGRSGHYVRNEEPSAVSNMPPVVSIVGYSGVGKTTLIEKIIRILAGRGYGIATIKHDAHEFNLDHEGKDSFRHSQAGAQAVAIASASRFALMARTTKEIELDAVIRILPRVDIVITEGYKAGAYPKIVVHRAEHSESPPCLDDPTVLVFASNCQIANRERIDLDDAEKVATLIEHRFLRR